MKTCRPRIKICGLTHLEDAIMTVEAGADALGFVFYAQSKRYIEPMLARIICERLPAFVSSVALVVNASDHLIQEICTTVRPSYIQFHGDESVEDCIRWNYPYIKALRMKPNTNPLDEIIQHCEKGSEWCRGILLDTYHSAQAGGTGESFDWTTIPSQEKYPFPLILAGGLTPTTIENAVKTVQPWGVDVSSGVEYAPGRKCPAKVRAFIQGVLNAAVSLP